jgi:hypothetical protein
VISYLALRAVVAFALIASIVVVVSIFAPIRGFIKPCPVFEISNSIL